MLTPSSMILPLGTLAPDFALPDPDGKIVKLADIKGSIGTVIFFACNHCPYVVHVQKGVGELAAKYIPQGISFVAINSNDVESYPADHPSKMKEFAEKGGWKFPYLFDETQKVAHDYHAACTPDFYLFDSRLKLAYRGQFDSTRPGNLNPQEVHLGLRDALDCILRYEDVFPDQRPSMGCNIKWKRI